MRFTLNLQAGIPVQQDTAGRLFLLEDAGAAGSLTLRFFNGSEEIEQINAASRGFRFRIIEGGEFSHFTVQATVATQAKIIVSRFNIDIDLIGGAAVQATIVNTPLPVSNDRGAPAAPVYVAGITNLSDAPATGMTNGAAVACSSAVAVIKAANVAHKACRFYNQGPDPVAIGAAGITWATRTIVLQPLEVWVEERAANLAWSAICDAGKTASVTAQVVSA